MADTAQQAEARRQLRARGEQLAPRASTGGRSAAGADTAEAITGVPVRHATQQRAARRTRSTGGRAGSAGGRRGGAPTRPGAFQRGGYVERTAVRQFRAVPRTLVVEWVLAELIIALKPTEPAGQGKASDSTVPQLISAGLVYMLLAAFAAVGPRQQRIANLFGGLVLLALFVKNHGGILGAVLGISKGQPADYNPAPSPTPQDIMGTSVTNPGVPAEIQQAAGNALGGWRGVVSFQPTPSGQPPATQQLTGG